MSKRRNGLPKVGQRYRWGNAVLTIEEVDPGGEWAMIRGTWLNLPDREPWTKQQPIADGGLPDDWVLLKGTEAP